MANYLCVFKWVLIVFILTISFFILENTFAEKDVFIDHESSVEEEGKKKGLI
jgi:hypothetical protein